jgi:hypothetical protein
MCAVIFLPRESNLCVNLRGMFIYNVTVNIDEDAHEGWLRWMLETHIPQVMSTGCFTARKMVKVLRVEDPGHTYSIQYTFRTMEDFENYRERYAPALQLEHKRLFGDKFTAFRTLLEEIELK